MGNACPVRLLNLANSPELKQGLRPFVSALACAGFVFGLSGCTTNFQPVISTRELVGTWKGAEGQLSFNTDHSVKATDLRLDPVAGFLMRCPRGRSGMGTWQFLSPKGVGAMDLAQYRRGSLLDINFPVCFLSLTTWDNGRGPASATLCFSPDPDSPCEGALYYKEGERA